MRRVLSLVFAVIMIATFATAVNAVSKDDIPQDGLIGWFKLDGNLKNEVEGGEDAVWIGQNFSEPLWDEDEYIWWTGVDGYCWQSDQTDGIRFLNPGNEGFTMAIWFMDLTAGSYSPILWYGQQNQNPENWIGCWGNTVNPYEGGDAWTGYGPSLGSNNPAGTRPEIRPEKSLYDKTAEVPLPWTFITITCIPNEDGETTTTELYLNGEYIGTNTQTPNPYVENYEEAGCYIYTSCNYWDPALNGFVDECLIYNRVLSADEIAAIYAAYGTPPTYEEMEEVDLYGNNEPEDTTADTTKTEDTTKAPETSDTPETSGSEDTKAEDEKKGGCGSVVTGAAALVMTVVSVFGVAVIKRK